MRKIASRFRRAGCAGGGLVLGILLAGGALFGQDEIRKARIFEEDYPIVLESDLTCTVFLWEGELPAARIVGSEMQAERTQMSDEDKFYVGLGRAEGIELGQVFQILTVGDSVAGLGRLAQRVGRAHVVRLEEHRAVASIDKACRPVVAGQYLAPYVEREPFVGHNLGYEDALDPQSGTHGRVVYLDSDLKLAGNGQAAIVDLGKAAGLTVGQQLMVFRRVSKDMPRESFANVVVTDVQERSATVKVLSSRDPVKVGDEVQTR